jgi:hypothetical protein
MKYLVEAFRSDHDEGSIAVVPDLPGCSAFGRTPEAAVHEIGDATGVRGTRSSNCRQPTPPRVSESVLHSSTCRRISLE